MLPSWQHASTCSAISVLMMLMLVHLMLPVSTAVEQMPATLDYGLLVVGGKRLPLEKVSGLVAPHFAVVVRGKEGAKINRTVPLPSCLFKASGDGIQVAPNSFDFTIHCFFIGFCVSLWRGSQRNNDFRRSLLHT